MKKSICILSIFLLSFISAQTYEERQKIIASYDQDKIKQTQKELEKISVKKKHLLENYYKSHKPLPSSYEEGVAYAVVGIDEEGNPVYIRSMDVGSSQTVKSYNLNTGGSLNLDINGEDMVAGVWDFGIARPTHQEFKEEGGTSRIISFDGTASSSDLDHATQVTGILAGIGKSPDDVPIGGVFYPKGYSKGIAPAATILASSVQNDLSEMMDFASQGYMVSNHSYGLDASTWVNGDWRFGAYGEFSYWQDRISYENDYYQIVTAAGNDRNKGLNAEKGGYELVTSYANAKNTLTVGAIEELHTPSDVTLYTASSFGPTDDGRIKPNLVAKGVSVISPLNVSDSGYGIGNGTSASTPSITGSVLLLQQYHHQLYGSYMKSSTVRGLLQHTALDAGRPGPDYEYGWGIADVEAAAILLSEKDKGAIIEENVLSDQEVYTKTISTADSQPLVVSISWTDYQYYPYNQGEKDPDVKYLQNDLDVRVMKKNTDGQVVETYLPWKLDGKNPASLAIPGDNDVDNFERIDIVNPLGEYTIQVSHKGVLSGGGQKYSLIITGNQVKALGVEELESKDKFNTKIYPIPARNSLTISIDETVQFVIYTITGKKYMSGKLDKGKNTIDVSSLSEGIYIIRLDNGSTVETKKIILN